MQGNCIDTSHHCGFDTAGKILNHLFSNIPGTNFTHLNPRPAPEGWRQLGTIKEFDQHEFVEGDKE